MSKPVNRQPHSVPTDATSRRERPASPVVTTMREFARLAGVSRPTVSKYFSDPNSVRAPTRRRIEKALRTHYYRPNLLAANLKRKTSRMLGVLIPQINDPFFTELSRAIEKSAFEHGFFCIALSSHGTPQGERYALDSLLSMNVAGVIAAALGFASDLAAFERLRALVPLVMIDARSDLDEDFVGSDNRMGIALMVEYLARTGAQPVYFDMPHVNSNSLERLSAYRDAMTQQGLPARVVVDGSRYLGWDFERFGFNNALRLFDEATLSRGTILCANDRVAFGVLAAAYRRGVKVGRGSDAVLRVAGHDGQPLSQFAYPALTTIAQDVHRIGRVAVAALIDKISGKHVPPGQTLGNDLRDLLPVRLILRQSA